MAMTHPIRLLVCILALLVPLPGQAQRFFPEVAPAQAVVARNGMVVSQESRATRIGVDVLRKGGNAVDAAVAIGFAMAVTYPRAGNIGGGGFMVIHRADGRAVAIDYRETAPHAIHRDSFLDAKGNADPDKSRDSALAVGVPGTVAGLALAHEKYGSGKLSLAELIAPAIALARDGIPVEDDTAASLPLGAGAARRWPSRPGSSSSPTARCSARATAWCSPISPPRWRRSPAAVRAVSMKARRQRSSSPPCRPAGGVMTLDDLKSYRAVERPPVRGSYRGYDIVSMPPPSSGGVHLIEMLNILEGYDLRATRPKRCPRI